MTKPRRFSRGMSLGMVLCLTLLIVTLALTMASVSTFQLQVANETRYGQEALDLAESAVAQVEENMHTGTNGTDSISEVGAAVQSGVAPFPRPFGGNGESVQFPPVSNNVDSSDAWGRVSFNPSNTFGLNGSTLPGSVYNYNGQSPTGYQGVSIPAGMADIVAVGQSHGVVRTVEVQVGVPPYRYAVAGGTMLLEGNSTICGAPDMATAVGLAANPGPDAAHGMTCVATRDGVCPDACTLYGDLIYALHFSFPNNMREQGNGRIVPGNVPMPGFTSQQIGQAAVPLASWQQQTPGPLPTPDSSGNITTTLPYYVQSGDITISGSLVLNSSVVYVPGNFKAQYVSGWGAIVAKGQITVVCGNSVTQLNPLTAGVTLVGQSGVQISGGGGAFQGYIYSGSDIFIGATTLVGGAFASNPTGQIVLKGATIIGVPPGPGKTVLGSDLFQMGTDNPVVVSQSPQGSASSLILDLEAALLTQIPNTPTNGPYYDMNAWFDEEDAAAQLAERNLTTHQNAAQAFASGGEQYEATASDMAPKNLFVSFNGLNYLIPDQNSDTASVTLGGLNCYTDVPGCTVSNVAPIYNWNSSQFSASQWSNLVAPYSNLDPSVAQNVAGIDSGYLQYCQQAVCTEANSLLQPFPAVVNPLTFYNPNADSLLPDAPPLYIATWKQR